MTLIEHFGCFSCHPIWILELLWSAHDKFLQCIIRDYSDTGGHFGDVDWSARLLHVHWLCTKIRANCRNEATILSSCRLLHVSILAARKFLKIIRSSILLTHLMWFFSATERPFHRLSWSQDWRVFLDVVWYLQLEFCMEWCHLAKSTYKETNQKQVCKGDHVVIPEQYILFLMKCWEINRYQESVHYFSDWSESMIMTNWLKIGISQPVTWINHSNIWDFHIFCNYR